MEERVNNIEHRIHNAVAECVLTQTQQTCKQCAAHIVVIIIFIVIFIISKAHCWVKSHCWVVLFVFVFVFVGVVIAFIAAAILCHAS